MLEESTRYAEDNALWQAKKNVLHLFAISQLDIFLYAGNVLKKSEETGQMEDKRSGRPTKDLQQMNNI